MVIANKGWFVYCLSCLINDQNLSYNEYCCYSAQEIVAVLESVAFAGFAKEIEPDGDVRMWKIHHPDLGVITFNRSRFMEISIDNKKVITIEQGQQTDAVMGVFNWIPGVNRIKNAAFLTHNVSEDYIMNRFDGWPNIN